MSIITLENAVKLILEDQVVAMPTETVYGLAASIYSTKGLNLIFSTKERPFFDPLIVHIHPTQNINEIVDQWNEVEALLAKKFWPGPLTIIARKKNNLNPLITAGLDFVGVRSPSHPLALKLLELVKVPLAAPSANLFKKVSPTSAQHVIDEFQGKVPVLDGGPSELGIESTVVEYQLETNILSIYRAGSISKEVLELFFREQNKHIIVKYQASPVAPGQMLEHYQPHQTKLITIALGREALEYLLNNKTEIEFEKILTLLKKFITHNFTHEKEKLLFDHLLDMLTESTKQKTPTSDPSIFYLGSDLASAARLLYHQIRSANQWAARNDRPFIFCLYPQSPHWEMIESRLIKASSLFVKTT